jgi:glucokinase
MKVLGVDCGGSHLSCALVEDKKIVERTTMETDARSFGAMLPGLADALRGFCRRNSIAIDSCAGLAIGLPVVFAPGTGEVPSVLNKYRDLPDINLEAWGRQELQLPVRLENDARMALLGEQWAGAAVGAQDVVMVTLGTGIGGAVMLQGEMVNSRYGQAGCLGGHLTVNYRGRRCSCGAVGCAEAEASTAVLPEICREMPGFPGSLLAQEAVLNFETVFRCKDRGDETAAAVVEHCIEVWSALAVTLIHAYGPEVILFGGAVMIRGEEVLQPIREFVGRHIWRTTRGIPRVAAATLGSEAALFGAEAMFERKVSEKRIQLR